MLLRFYHLPFQIPSFSIEYLGACSQNEVSSPSDQEIAATFGLETPADITSPKETEIVPLPAPTSEQAITNISPQTKGLPRIVFLGNKDGQRVYVVNADGSGMKALNDIGCMIGLISPLIVDPSGDRFAYHNCSDGYIHIGGLDGADQTLPFGVDPITLSWSPDGTQIAYFKDIRLLIYGVRNMERVYEYESFGELHSNLEWSPNGIGLVWDSGLGHGESDIYTMTVEKGMTYRLTDGSGKRNILATWSPDGTKLAYISNADYGGKNSSVQSDIYWMYASGSGKTRVTNLGEEMNGVDWSPDGGQMVFSSKENLYRVNIDGTDLIKLNPPGMRGVDSTGAPQWSPDGEWILFSSNADIYLIRKDGSDLVKLADDRIYYHPKWILPGS